MNYASLGFLVRQNRTPYMEGNLRQQKERPINYGKYFERIFLSLTGISDAKNKNHPLWDQKSSLFLGSEIIEARNQQIRSGISEPKNISCSNLSELGLFDFRILPRTKYHMSPLPLLCTWYDTCLLYTSPITHNKNTQKHTTTAYRAGCVRDRASSSHKRRQQQHHHHRSPHRHKTLAPQQHHSSNTQHQHTAAEAVET